MRKSFIALLSLFLLSSLSLALAEAPSPTKVLNIGLILPLTGPAAFYGTHVKNGAILAYEAMSPEVRAQYNLIFEDDQFDARMALSAYQKLKAEKGLDVVILFGSQSGHSVIPTASHDGVLSLIFTVDPKVTQNRPGAYRLAVEAGTQAELLEKQFQKKGLKRFALLSTTHEAMLEYASKMKAEILKGGGEIAYENEFTKGETDFKSALLAIQQKKVDDTVVALLPPSLSAYAKQRKLALAEVPSYGFAQVENLPEIKASQGSLDGTMFSGLSLDESFKQSYRSRFQEEAGSFAGYSFEFLKQIEEARAKGATSAAAIGKFFDSKKEYSGCFGPFRRRDDNSYDIPASLLVIEQGVIEKAKD